jgi:hypothetical protein
MFTGFVGWHFVIIIVMYLVVLAVVGAALYVVVRLAVLHALKAHTRWLNQGSPPRASDV